MDELFGKANSDAQLRYSMTKGHSFQRIAVALYLVGVTGFEPATSSSRTKRAAKLRHTPELAD
jgi:hypothetical protein